MCVSSGWEDCLRYPEVVREQRISSLSKETNRCTADVGCAKTKLKSLFITCMDMCVFVDLSVCDGVGAPTSEPVVPKLGLSGHFFSQVVGKGV